MTIHHFQVLQSVLSQTCDVICKVHAIDRPEAFRRTEEFIRRNSEQWRLPNPNIDYNDPYCRMAYLYMNVAVHAHLVEQALGRFPQIEQVLRVQAEHRDELRICALGGGPGSELLGLTRFAERLIPSIQGLYLDFMLVDRTREWDESWHALKQGVDDYQKVTYGTERTRWPVIVNRSFLPLDATQVHDFENFPTRFNGTNIFLLCYLVSELKANTTGLSQVLDLLTERAGKEAMFLFIDRDEKHVRNTVLDLIKANPYLQSLATYSERGRTEDDPADLGEWYINIPSLPRQKWLTFFSLARKTD